MIAWSIFDGSIAARISLALAHSLWQVGLLAFGLLLIERLWKRQSPEATYLGYVTAIVLALLAVPITFARLESSPSRNQQVSIGVGNPSHFENPIAIEPVAAKSTSPIPLNTAPQTAAPSVHDPHFNAKLLRGAWRSMSLWIAGLYACGVVLMLARILGGVWYVHRLRARSMLVTQGPLAIRLASLTVELRLRLAPTLAQVEGIVIPRVIGLLRPTILLPVAAASGIGPAELEMILAHELAHVQRYDLWVNLLQRLAEAVLFFNPFLWLLSRRASALREICCDDLACRTLSVQYAQPRVRYAQALMRVAELAHCGSEKSAEIAAVGASGRNPSELRRRIARLVGEPLREPLQLSRSGGVVLTAIAALLLLSPGIQVSGDDDAAVRGPGPALSGRVQDNEGKPIAGADVGLVLADTNDDETRYNTHPKFEFATKTDARGDFKIPLRGDLRKKWGTVWRHAKGYGPSRLSSTGSLPALDPANITLDVAEGIALKLVDARNRPVADAAVRVLRVRVKNSVSWPVPVDWQDRFVGKTDVKGFATISSFVPTSLDRLRVDAEPSGRIEFVQEYFLNVKPEGRAPHFTFPIPDSGHIEGELTANTADAPREQRVKLSTEVIPAFGPRFGVYGIADILPERSGKFTVPKLAAGRLSIEVVQGKGSSWCAKLPTDEYVVADATTSLVIPLERGVLVRGLIRKQDTGEGYPNFGLAVIYGPSAIRHEDMQHRAEVKTDKGGRFSAYVPPGPIELRLHSAPRDYHHVEWWDGRGKGGVWGSRREVPQNVAEFDLDPIDLVPTEEVTGRLVDKEGKPLASWTVYGYPAPDVMNSFSGVQTDRDGSFSGRVPKTHPPQIWKVSHRVKTDEGYGFKDYRFQGDIISESPLVLEVGDEVKE